MARIEVRRQRARLGRGLFALAALWFGFLGLMAPAPPARATGGAVITNGTVGLGVHNEGHLIIPSEIRSAGGELRFGLRLLQGQFESLSPGCDCEGWGIADPDAGISGDANESNGGVHNLTPISFAATPTSADSVVKLDDLFEIRHHYFPSPATRFLYECQVTVKNISSKRVGQFLYRRLMDWDVEPTPFREFVTIQRGTAAALVFSSDDGFGEADPLQALDEIEEGTLNTSFEDSGPADHGAAFDFSFLNLDPGASQTFSIFYGAAPTEAEAEGALW
ncbi:MAG: hypothetical protein FJX77_06450, partial [Armatimonadetes bacterium]|nr:hypothetical protein [Armatimonadota bacterium]